MWYSSNKIAHRVKTQARSQNNRSRALKWGIVCLYSSSSFGDTTKYMKIWVLQFFHFCKKVAKSLCKITKLRKLRKMTLFVFNHIFKSIWATETYNTSFESSWPFVLTSSLSFDSRKNHFWDVLQNTSRILYESPSSKTGDKKCSKYYDLVIWSFPSCFFLNTSLPEKQRKSSKKTQSFHIFEFSCNRSM